MTAVDIDMRVQTLLERTVSTHGFWLINHADIVSNELLAGLERRGMAEMVGERKDWRGDYTSGLYRKIANER